MRVKVRFNAEAGQPPIVLDMRFLPRIGEQIHLGFRKVIEVLEVRRVDNDNRFGGIVRAKYVHEQRPAATPPLRPMPMPPMPIRSLGVSPPPAVAAAAAQAATAQSAAVFGDVPLEELAAVHAGKPAGEPRLSVTPAAIPDPAF
jgi:hypothetical protein